MLQTQTMLVVGFGAILVAFGFDWFRHPGRRARSSAVAVFSAYVVLVVATTMFPIAVDSFGEASSLSRVNLVPLRGLLSPSNISREQALPNIVLGIPFGLGVFFVSRGIRPWKAFLAGVAFFALVEVIQLGVATLFPASPRLLDINDLMLNGMGVAFGILGFVLFADWFIRADHKVDLDSSQWVDYLRSVVQVEKATDNSTNRDEPSGSDDDAV